MQDPVMDNIATSDVKYMNSNKGNSECDKKTELSSDQMFSLRTDAQLWAVTTDWLHWGNTEATNMQ